MLKLLALHWNFNSNLAGYSVSVEESQASVASTEDIKSTKRAARWFLISDDKYSKYEAFINLIG